MEYTVGEIAEAHARLCKNMPLSSRDRLILSSCVERMFELLLVEAKRGKP